MKQIILLTDFSENAQNAIHFALQFFKMDKCHFHVMNVHKIRSYISDDLMYAPTTSIHDAITKTPKKKINTLINSLKKEFHNANHSFDAIIDFDVFTDAITQAIKTHNVDYVVMGTNGVTGAKEVVFGSNTQNVIKKINCKTIVVPQDYKFKTITEFMLSLQPEDTLNDRVFETLTNFVKNHKLHLHLLRLNLETGSNEIAILDQQKTDLINCDYSSVSTTASDEALTHYVNTNAIDMLGIIVHDYTFFERLFNPSKSYQISNHIQLPLLVLRDK